MEAALDTLATRCRIVVIKRGGQGCLVRHGAQTIRCPAFNVPVVDVTSAGDIFNAGFLYGFLHGMPLMETIKFASACGALSVSRASNLGMPSVNEVGTFLAARGDQLVIG